MSDVLMIGELIQKLNAGQIRVPSFQRGFVWDADRIAHLMDSIYKQFPFGNLLLWRTKTPLRVERKLGPYVLPTLDAGYPIDYVLDGQQRATSIFGVFQHALAPAPGEDELLFKIYFDLTQSTSAQDSQFIHVPDEERDPTKHFPLRLLFNPPEYRKYLRDLPEPIAEKIDVVFERFSKAKIPIQTFETNDRAAVAIVFERINRMGVELDTLQLLSAWTWSEDFDLQDEFANLAEELESFGFKDVGEDSDLLLRCCAAIISHDASPASIIEMKGVDVRERFDEIKRGVLGAIDFLRANLKVTSAASLPFSNIIIPLSVLFATPDEQGVVLEEHKVRQVRAWIWRTFFTRRYSKRLEQLNDDVRAIISIKKNLSSNLGDFAATISESYFAESTFNLNSVNTKTFVLMLANNAPLNFISGQAVSLDKVLQNGNKKEFHHIFPRKFLAEKGVDLTEINSLVNFAVIGRAENNRLGGDAPSIYRSKMSGETDVINKILASALCPRDLFDDDFEKFKKERLAILISTANRLMSIAT